MTTKEPSRLTKALLETADDMRRTGVIDALTHAKLHAPSSRQQGQCRD